MRALLLAFALVLALPTAAADVNLCQQTTGVCVFSWSWDAGSGSCEQGTSDWYSFRTFRVSHDNGSVQREVEVRNDCSASARDAGDTERSSLRVEYWSYDRGARAFSWLIVDWHGQDAPSGSTCEVDVYAHNVDPLPEGTTSEDCPARPPPRALLLP